MKKGLVSVVVPVYNVEKYLNDCIQSLVEQSYKNLEILLIDDGSSDSSPILCDKWAEKDERVKVIHKENEGAGKSRNKGINIATGEYIFFLDSDDYVKRDLVSKCVSLINQEKSAAVMYGVELVNDSGKVLERYVPYSNKYVYLGGEVLEQFLPEMIYSENEEKNNLKAPACMAFFYSMDVIKRNDWHFESETEYISEDLFSILKLMKYINKVIVLDESLYCYRKGHLSLSSSSRMSDYTLIKKFYEQCMELCNKNLYSDKTKKNIGYPYISFTIVCLKSIVLQNKSINVIYKELCKILSDDQLSTAISNLNYENEKSSKKLFYYLVQHKRIILSSILIWAQAKRRKK